MGFPKAVANEALFKCRRCCCICHKFCGTRIELHHIRQKADGGEDTFENCIPLCFDCHSDMGKADPKHPKGKQYSENELIKHRDNWYAKAADTQTISCIELAESDRNLFSEICSYFTDDVLYLLRDHPFGGLFKSSYVRPLLDLSHRLQNPLCVFINTDLEKLRTNLDDNLHNFLNYLTVNTFPAGPYLPEYNAARLWLLDNGEMCIADANREEAHIRFEKEANKMDALADTLWYSYIDLVKLAKQMQNCTTSEQREGII